MVFKEIKKTGREEAIKPIEIIVNQDNFEKLFWKRVATNVKSAVPETLETIKMFAADPKLTLHGIWGYLKENPKEFTKNLTMVIPLCESLILETNAYRLAGNPAATNQQKMDALNRSADMFSASTLALLTTTSFLKIAKYVKDVRKAAAMKKKIRPFKTDAELVAQFSKQSEMYAFLELPVEQRLPWILKKSLTPDSAKLKGVHRAMLEIYMKPLPKEAFTNPNVLVAWAKKASRAILDAAEGQDPIRTRNAVAYMTTKITKVLDNFEATALSDAMRKSIADTGIRMWGPVARKSFLSAARKATDIEEIGGVAIRTRAMETVPSSTMLKIFYRHQVTNPITITWHSLSELNEAVATALKVPLSPRIWAK